MTRFILRRLALMIVVFVGLVIVAFLLTHVLPGDPAQAAAGRNATADQIAAVRAQLGLNSSLVVQFGRYVRGLLRGDLGISVFTHESVLTDIGQVLPSSIELVVAAMVINIVVALPLGVLSAYRVGRLSDITARFVVILGAAVPVFWLGLILQLVFADKLNIMPLSGQLGFGYSVPHRTGIVTLDALLAGDFPGFLDAVDHLILPAITLSAAFVPVVTRTVRSSMLSVLSADYITLARATGASEWRVVIRHGLRNALLPVTTILGMQLGWMLGATVLIESTFSRTGIGAYMVTAVLQDDLYAVTGSILVIGVVFIVANFAVDLLQLWLNPRLREPRRSAVAAAADGDGGAEAATRLELAS